MTIQSKRDYLQAIRSRYRTALKEVKGAILDEFCTICGYNRKYAIRILKKKPKQPKRKPGPQPKYRDTSLLQPLKRIWFATDQMCSKKLQAALPLWLPFYEQEYGPLAADIKTKLLAISPSTIDRTLQPVRVKYKTKGLCGTKPGTLLKNQIPIITHSWDVTKPGFFEADTVAHCGNSLAGNFVWSLTFTDIYSGWTENRAVWNKGSYGVVTQIKDIEATLAFPILGFDCDNGSEFLNHHLLRYFANRPQSLIHFTRSRPYKKNDNDEKSAHERKLCEEEERIKQEFARRLEQAVTEAEASASALIDDSHAAAATLESFDEKSLVQIVARHIGRVLPGSRP